MDLSPPATWPPSQALRPSSIPNSGSNLLPKVSDRLFQSLRQRYSGRPFQVFARFGDVGLALFRVVLRQRLEDNSAARAGGSDDFLGELQHGQLRRIADVHRQVVIAHHQTMDALDEVGHITKASGLRALAKNRDRLVLQSLADE